MWSIEARARARLAAETNLCTARRQGDLPVCLVYPNYYAVGMSNLGFQAAYRIFAQHDACRCERAFLPEPADRDALRRQAVPLRSLESQRPLLDFELLAFSLSFETDYLNLLEILEAGGVPLLARDRAEQHPLVIAGGPATFLNPEPVADFVDLFLIGEGEELIPEFIDRYVQLRTRGVSRAGRIRGLSALSGVYWPARLVPEYSVDGTLAAATGTAGGAPRVTRRIVQDLDAHPTTSQILTPETVFGEMYLVEASRGCEWGCRFCAAGYMYRPVRYRSTASVKRSAASGLQHRATIGLIGAEMASQPGIASICEFIGQAGGRASPSSLKADVMSRRLANALGNTHNRSVTVAPEAGSERMRRVINKNLTEPEILRAADWLVGGGVRSLKLYFMVGRPTETEHDVDGIVALSEKIYASFCGKRGRVGTVALSVNAFSPKPWTPFQWEPMESVASLRAKLARVRKGLAHLPRVTVHTESPREAYYQTLLSRGDRRMGAFLLECLRQNGDWWAVIQRLRREARIDSQVVSLDRFVHRRYHVDEILPWDFIDHSVSKQYLWSEWRKGLVERETPPCDVSSCHSCQAC